VRLSELDVNKTNRIIDHKFSVAERVAKIKSEIESDGVSCCVSYGLDVKIIKKIKQPQKYFAEAEISEAVMKYDSGMSIEAIADYFGCHYSTEYPDIHLIKK
jgi:hypothetical protein